MCGAPMGPGEPGHVTLETPRERLTLAWPGALCVLLKRPIAILILILVSIDVVASSCHTIAISGGGRPCLGTRRLRDTVRVPFVYVRRMRSVSLFESHTCPQADRIMRLQSASMRRIRVPRRASRSGCRVAPGPAGLSPSALSSPCRASKPPVRSRPNTRAAVHPHRRLPRPDALLRRRGHGARLHRARLRATGTWGGHW